MSEHRRSSGSTGHGARPRRLVTAVVATSAATLLIAGCGSGSSGASGGSSGSGLSDSKLSPIQARVTELMKPAQPVKLDLPAITGLSAYKGKTVLVVPAIGVVFSTAVKQVSGALAKVGIKTQVCDGQGNPSTVSQCLSQAPSIKGIAGVMSIGFPYQGAPAAFKNLTAHNIPVLVAQQNPDGQASSKLLAFVGTTDLFTKAAEAADDYVIAKSGGKADVLSLGLDESQDVRDASKHMTDYLTSTCSTCKVTMKSVASTQISTAGSLVSTAVLADPKLNWLVSLNADVSGTSVLKGLQSSNASAKVKQGGIGNGLLSLQQVKSGSAAYSALISGELLAYNWTDALLRLIDGKPVPATYPVVVRLIDKTNIGDLKLAPEEAFGFGWFGGKDTFTSDYAKLWGAQ